MQSHLWGWATHTAATRDGQLRNVGWLLITCVIICRLPVCTGIAVSLHPY